MKELKNNMIKLKFFLIKLSIKFHQILDIYNEDKEKEKLTKCYYEPTKMEETLYNWRSAMKNS